MNTMAENGPKADKWFVVYTKPRGETQALDNLERQGYHCWLPRLRQWKRRRGVRQQVVEPMFPRYLFIRLAMGVSNVAPIRSTLGVTALLRFGNEYPEVPDALIEALKGRAGEDGIIDADTPSFKAGQQVTVEDGRFKGLSGIFQATTSNERVILLLDLLGRQNRVVLPASSVSSR